MIAAFLLIAAALLWPTPAVRGSLSERPPRQPRLSLNQLAACAAFVLPVVAIGGPLGMTVGVGAGWFAHRFVPERFSRSDELRELQIARTLPDAADLLAALLRIGLPDTEALAMAARAVPDPIGPVLDRVARMRRLGAEPAVAWRSAADVPQLRELGSALGRQADTGAPVAAILDRIAVDARREYYTHAQAAARATSVRSVIPLGVCFLPAFFLLCVVPIVAGLVGELLW